MIPVGGLDVGAAVDAEFGDQEPQEFLGGSGIAGGDDLF
jgi:hypothetical protein